MIFITRGELFFIRDLLLTIQDEETEHDPQEVAQAISLIESLIYITPEEEYQENLDLYLDEDDNW